MRGCSARNMNGLTADCGRDVRAPARRFSLNNAAQKENQVTREPGMDVAIVDYGLGNLFSVARACERVGLRAEITHDARALERSRAVILPGVGAFGDAMQSLKKLDLIGPLRHIACSGKPFFGICLGLQLLMSESEEFGRHAGLDLLPGRVVHLGTPRGPHGRLKVPEVCWNRVLRPAGPSDRWHGTPLDGLSDGVHMYFVHSFYVQPEDQQSILATTRYGDIEYCSAVRRGNLVAFQFHPERSGPEGVRIYQNIARIVNEHSSVQETRHAA